MIKLNVPLKAIGIEIDTACNFFFSSFLFRSVSLSLSLSFSSSICPFLPLIKRKHTLIVRVNEKPKLCHNVLARAVPSIVAGPVGGAERVSFDKLVALSFSCTHTFKSVSSCLLAK